MSEHDVTPIDDLIDVGCAADKLLGNTVQALWRLGGDIASAVYFPLGNVLISCPDWGLSLFAHDDAWLWIPAERFQRAYGYDGQHGPVLTIEACDLTVTVMAQEELERRMSVERGLEG
ncbi:MAG: hypothetical protein M3515_10065 [Actinomycetota bacterium]|jgi:hypothetical protein|nr:hypothetical protein [Actinomycetota bacterium]MDQ3485796.1 hypothetical protein [Actinomycetota bacterium]